MADKAEKNALFSSLFQIIKAMYNEAASEGQMSLKSTFRVFLSPTPEYKI